LNLTLLWFCGEVRAQPLLWAWAVNPMGRRITATRKFGFIKLIPPLFVACSFVFVV